MIDADLKRDFARSESGRKVRAAILVLPLFVFMLVSFLGPIAVFLTRSVSDDVVGPILPETIEVLAGWDGVQEVPDAAFEALARDLANAPSASAVAGAATRLNYAVVGARALLIKARTSLAEVDGEASVKRALLAASPEWGRPAIWSAIKHARGPYGPYYLLDALDLEQNAAGGIEMAAPNERIFIPVIWRTFEIALWVTVLALLIGFPFAYLISSATPRIAKLLIATVMLSFWTSVLVRTLSWIVLFQKEGILNDLLTSMGFIRDPFTFLYSRFAVYVALVHIFLPYMVLPIYSVMLSATKTYTRAASSLGAPPLTVFRRVYLPQIFPGIAAGTLLVFIQCLGVFVTPALVGGPADQGIAYMIAHYVKSTLNWGLAASLSVILLIATAVFYWVFRRLAGNGKDLLV